MNALTKDHPARRRDAFRHRIAQLVNHLDQPVEALCFAAALLLAHPSVGAVVVGGLIAFSGEALRQWAARNPRPLTWDETTGPYRLMRHPDFTARFLRWVGIAMAASNALVFGVGIFVLGSALIWRARIVDRDMVVRGGPWAVEYLHFVPAFCPQLPVPGIRSLHPAIPIVRPAVEHNARIETRGPLLVGSGLAVLLVMPFLSDALLVKWVLSGALGLYFLMRLLAWSRIKFSSN